jgi:hypothetical protein
MTGTDLLTPDTIGDYPTVDPAAVRDTMEYYAQRNWSDGLPVVPVTESYLQEFLARTSRDADEVLLEMSHLNRRLTVRLAAINAAMAGCLPEYFPVVLAAWDGINTEPMPRAGIWQSTTGTAPFLVVNGPARNELSINSAGSIFGSGFRANATIGRSIRLTCINVFGLHPHLLDQATQANPSKYMMCIGENEEASPWAPLHVDQGFAAGESAVSAFVIRAVMHIEARHTMVPEQLATDLTNSVCRTGALLTEFNQSLIVLGPEHAHLFANAGWSKDDLRRFILEHAVVDRDVLRASGKEALSRHARWRVPTDHLEAVPDSTASDRVPLLRDLDGVQVMVAGANNAGVSAVVDIFGRPGHGRPFSIAKVEEHA